MRRFYLGLQDPLWLRWAWFPSFVSHRRFQNRIKQGRRKLPRASYAWALDSGGFTELTKHGRDAYAAWPAKSYADWVAVYVDEIGSLEWAAIQDWMCEEEMLKLTGMTVAQHQALTTRSYLTLMGLRPWLPWVPILQGHGPDDYRRHADEYMAHGIELEREPVVGIGSVCRRQTLQPIANLITDLSRQGLKLHGFGVNKSSLWDLAPVLDSSDSMAWTVDAGRNPPLPGHTHPKCTSCFAYACKWRETVDAGLSSMSWRYYFANEFLHAD